MPGVPFEMLHDDLIIVRLSGRIQIAIGNASDVVQYLTGKLNHFSPVLSIEVENHGFIIHIRALGIHHADGEYIVADHSPVPRP